MFFLDITQKKTVYYNEEDKVIEVEVLKEKEENVKVKLCSEAQEELEIRKVDLPEISHDFLKVAHSKQVIDIFIQSTDTAHIVVPLFVLFLIGGEEERITLELNIKITNSDIKNLLPVSNMHKRPTNFWDGSREGVTMHKNKKK